MAFRRTLTAALLGASVLTTLAIGGTAAQAASATEYGIGRPAGNCDVYRLEAQKYKQEGDDYLRKGNRVAADRCYNEADAAMKTYYACLRG